MALQYLNKSHPMYLLLLLQFILLSTTFVTVNAIKCPINCKCSWILDGLEVNCSQSGLTDYPDFDDLPIENLDLSGNQFTEFPTQLADMNSLIFLDLSNNKITYLNEKALIGFVSLRTLNLANNSIANWEALNPSETFRNAPNLQHLVLSGNRLNAFTTDNPKQILISESLNVLELEACSITNVGGEQLINYLPNLQRLVLSKNSLNTLTNLPSRSLRILELNNCNLQYINTNLLQGFPSLERLELSWNSALQFGSGASGGAAAGMEDNFVISYSLNHLDVSYCNLDEINLSGLPQLTTVQLRGNMLREIKSTTFANNTHLESIDLARNSLRLISSNAFVTLKHLTKVDLSNNEIARLDRNIVRANDLLISLNLSRNFIEKVSIFISNSLRDINLSWCEIIFVDVTALSGLASIQNMDLSHNLIRDLPSGLQSATLKNLDLSNCKLSNINNNTFRNFPELASLRLNGNRFTNPLSAEYFQSNRYLDAIWIGDNPWICNCYDNMFMDFYEYVITKPQKLKDKMNVRCASPSYYYGKTWESACGSVWTPNGRAAGTDKIWSTLILCIVVIGAVLFALTCFRKFMHSRKQRLNREEYRENQDEMSEIRRQNQRMLEEEGTPNAPNFFETNLPSYEDALRMPKLERPAKSMMDLSASARGRRKLLRSQTENDTTEHGDCDEVDSLQLDHRQHFRSVDMLANRQRERCAMIPPIQRRHGEVEPNNWGSRRFSIEASRFPPAHMKSQNLQSAEQIGNFQSYENSPYTKRKAKIAEIPPFKRATLKVDSVEFLTDPEFEVCSKPGSPFARRKPKRTPPSIAPAVGEPLAPAVENYFGVVSKGSSSTSSVDGSGFHVVIEPDISSLNDANGSSSPVGDGATVEHVKRKKRKNSSSRRASGNFNAAAAAAAADETSSSSDREPIVVVHKPMQETLF